MNRKGMIPLVVSYISFLLLALAPVPAQADSTKVFFSFLNGAQEVDPTTGLPTNSAQMGTALLTLNENSAQLCISLSFTGVTGTEVGAHIHGPAAPDVNADIIFPLSAGNPKTDCFPLSNAQKRDLKAGLWYLNIHSSTFPSGELRGQILPVKGVTYRD